MAALSSPVNIMLFLYGDVRAKEKGRDENGWDESKGSLLFILDMYYIVYIFSDIFLYFLFFFFFVFQFLYDKPD